MKSAIIWGCIIRASAWPCGNMNRDDEGSVISRPDPNSLGRRTSGFVFRRDHIFPYFLSFKYLNLAISGQKKENIGVDIECCVF